MSKYDEYIKQLKQEANDIDVSDLKLSIKQQYQNQNAKKPFVLGLKRLSYTLSFLAMSVCLVILVLNTRIVNPPEPYAPKSISETYAFELLNATNILTSMDSTTLDAMRKLSQPSHDTLEKTAKQIHKYYLTSRQVLLNEQVEYVVKESSDQNYEYEMELYILDNDDKSKCSIFFNKLIKEIDDDEEVYDLEGIIIINDQEYAIEGETEIEEDEFSTNLKVHLNDYSYFIIEQEIEDDEQDFIQTYVVNGKTVQQNRVSIEVENKKTVIVVEEEGQENCEMTIKLKDDKIKVEVKNDDYEGKILITSSNNQLKYYFEEENVTILLEIIKKINKITNKNDYLFVY